MLLRQAAKWRLGDQAGICENDVDAPHFFANLTVEAVDIGRLGDIALNRRRIWSEKDRGRFELGLPAARDVHARAFFHENLGGRQANSGVSTGDNSDLSIEFRHFFLSHVG